MDKVIRKRIRHNREGLNLAADIDAVIAINTGEDAGASHTSAHSSHSHVVVQDATTRGAHREPQPADPSETTKEKP